MTGCIPTAPVSGRRSRSIPLMLLLTLVLATPRYGRTETDAEVGVSKAIEEITVTARRREEILQETPVSITAFSEGSLVDRSVKDLSELTAFTPNMRFTASAAQSTNAQVYIRGIGQSEGTINSEPRVGLYLDDVYQARPLGSILSVFDTKRVEVLRGPQGTLYGKNAIGGAINVIANRPEAGYRARAEVEMANLDGTAVRLMGNLPIELFGLGDRLFLRGTFIYETRDGYLHDFHLDEYFSDHDLLQGTAALRFLPTDTLDLQLSYGHSYQDQMSKRGDCELIAAQAGSEFMQAVADSRAITALGGSFTEECNASGPWGLSTNMPNDDRLETRKIHGFATWDTPELGPFGSLTVKSISAYQSLLQNFNFDWDSTALTMIHSVIPDLAHSQFSQELRVHGDLWDGRIHWTSGGFYLREQSWGDPTHTIISAPDFSFVDMYWPLEVTVEERSDFQHQTAAWYVSGDVEPVDAVQVNAGFRYGWEEKRLHKARKIGLCVHATPPICAPWGIDPVSGKYNIFNELVVPSATEGEATDSWTAATGNVSVSYDLSEEIYAYVGYQRGFSSGGFNYIGDDANDVPNAFDPEQLHGVEVGLKTRWLDSRLVANLSYFFNFYEDMQVRIQEADNSGTRGQFVGVQSVIRNAGDATIQGMELEVVSAPIEGLMLNGNLGLTFAQYDEFRILDPDATLAATRAANCPVSDPKCDLPDDVTIVHVFHDVTDNDFQNTPRVNFDLGARYRWVFREKYEISPWIDYAWQSRLYFDVANTQELSQSPNGILSGSLSFTELDSRTRIVVWAKNITDERFLDGGYSLGSYATRFYGTPRTFGVTVTQELGGD